MTVALSVLQILRAIADGYDVRGVYYWTLMDNIEWHHGFNMKFGLYEWDPQTHRPGDGSNMRLREGSKALAALHLALPDAVVGVQDYARKLISQDATGKGLDETVEEELGSEELRRSFLQTERETGVPLLSKA